MKRPATVCAALSLTAILMAGCGSSATTKKDVVARANAICSSTLDAARALQQGNAQYYTQLAKVVGTEATKLKALPRPATDRAELDLFITSVAQAAAHYQKLASAERTGDQAAIADATAQLAASPASSYASAYGLDECSRRSGTLVGH